MEFVVTESGYEDGMGGASNAAAGTGYHYILFGRQTDDQHPVRGDVYFEFDDQIHGSVDVVTAVKVTDGAVEFALKDMEKIVVRRGMEEPQWCALLKSIKEVFPDERVHKA